MSIELIERALDSNAFKSSDTAAGYINPEYWDKRVMDHIRVNMVMLPLGQDVTSEFPGDGDTFNLTILAQPTIGAAVAETASLSVAAFAPTQVQLTPTEYGIAYQVTDKELRRAFLPLMERMSRDIGYGIAKIIDETILDDVTTNAGNSIVANSVVSSDVASSDTLDHDDVLEAMKANAVDEHDDHRALIVHPYMHKDLSADATFLTADKFGSDMAVNRKGFVGMVFGIPVYSTTQVDLGSSKGKAVLISSPDAFSYIFRTPVGGVVRQEYTVLERKNTIGGTVDFDTAVTRANAICTIECYAA